MTDWLGASAPAEWVQFVIGMAVGGVGGWWAGDALGRRCWTRSDD